jgi:hypothetical protein
MSSFKHLWCQGIRGKSAGLTKAQNDASTVSTSRTVSYKYWFDITDTTDIVLPVVIPSKALPQRFLNTACHVQILFLMLTFGTILKAVQHAHFYGRHTVIPIIHSHCTSRPNCTWRNCSLVPKLPKCTSSTIMHIFLAGLSFGQLSQLTLLCEGASHLGLKIGCPKVSWLISPPKTP